MQLPIDQHRSSFLETLASQGPGGRIVLSAPTGSGKSTRVPVWCHEAGLGPVLVIEPRRIACRTLAQWVAQGLETTVGKTVGYSVRFEQRYSAETRVLFVTPGVARRFVLDGDISRYATIVFDEFHERSWETDAVMAVLACESQPRRLILMSATLSAQRLVEVYGAEPVESFGRSFPVDVEYRRDPTRKTGEPSEAHLTSRVADAIRESWDEGRQGSALVFLPGLAAMRDVAKRLPGYPVKLLHGTFANSEQDSAFSDATPRIVLATNVAESSLTVPGITLVIDSGLEKRPIHQAGYVALATVPISTSSAEQRAGRAGRTAPGRCLRLWDRHARLDPDRAPDLERMELDDLVLFLASLRPDGLETPLRWVDPPPAFAWDRALLRLTESGLVDDRGRATALGLRVSRLPVDTDWARLLALAPPELVPDLCDLHSVSSTRRSFYLQSAGSDQVEARKADLGEEPWRRCLSLLRLGHPDKHGLDRDALSESRRLSKDLMSALGTPSQGARTGSPHPELGRFLAAHWPQRHFVKREKRDAWANGLVECRAARGEELPDDCQAAVFLQVEPYATSGLKVELRGRFGLPTSFAQLRRAGYGEPELEKIRWENGRVVAKVLWKLGGRLLGTREEPLSGPPLRQALGELFRSNRWMKGVWPRWEEQEFYAELRAELAGQPWSDNARAALERRLQELGIETADDLELLSESDLEWRPVDRDELEALGKVYPRLYTYGGVAYAVKYLPKRHRVTLSWISGAKGARPSPQHLPRWNGWAVEVEERGRVLPLR